MHAPKKKRFGDLDEPALHCELRKKNMVCRYIGAVKPGAAKNLNAYYTEHGIAEINVMKQMSEPSVGRLLAESEPVFVTRRDLAHGVDKHRPWIRQHCHWLGLEGSDTAFEMAGFAKIVTVMPAKETTPRFRNQEVVVPSGASVDVVAKITDSPIHGCVTTANFLGTVIRTIVGEYYLEVVEGLREQGIQCPLQKHSAVVDRDALRHNG